MLTKTLSEAKKKQRNILIKAMNNDIGSIDSAKYSWNPAQISERAKDISYIRSLVDTWNPAQLNEALKMLDLPVIDTWNPAQIEEQRRNLVFYLAERTLTGNPITLKILGNLTPEVTGLKVFMSPIQDLNGYDHPWAGGAGKNKLDSAVDVINATPSDTNAVDLGTFTAKANTYYTVSCMQHSALTSSERNTFIVNYDGTNHYEGYENWHNSAGIHTYTFSVTTEQEVNVKFWAHTISNNCKYDNFMVEIGQSATPYAPYSNICPISGRTEASVTRTAGEDVETKTHEYNETIWWGEDDFKNGGMEVIGAEIASYDGETLSGEWMSDRDVYAPDTTPTTGAQVVYKNTPNTIETTPEEITLLKGTNVLSTDGDSIELKYKQNF